MSRRRQIRAILFERQGGLCCYCKVKMVHPPRPSTGKVPRNTATLEHLRRRAEGGTHHRDNLALACARCNSGRKAVDWFTYASRKQGEAI